VSTQHIWTPGIAGPLDEFVGRVDRLVSAFAQEHGLKVAELRVELADGSQHLVQSISPDPGFGFFSVLPHVAAGEEPRQVIVPIGAVKLIEISAPDPERPFGFVVSE
jgi:hypothetical protein